MKTKQKILLHSCCAPCSTAVIERLKDDYEIIIFYYNPNIYPEEEYIKRKNEEIKYIKHLLETDKNISISMQDADYDPEKFYEVSRGFENEREGGARCAKCFRLRLLETAKQAKNLKIDLFGTTLTVSPHKNSDLINAIGREIEKEIGVKFLVSNFKKQDGYKRSIELSKENNIYRQNYCGCKFALDLQRNEAPESLNKKY